MGSLTASMIRLMAEKGLSALDIAEIAEASSDATPPSRSVGAARQARYRHRNALKRETVTRDAESDADAGVTPAVTAQVIDIRNPTPSRPSPPNPPNPPIPAQSDIFASATRGAEKPVSGSPQRKYLISDGWTPNADERRYAQAEGMTEDDISREAKNFVDHFVDKQERRPGWTRSWQRWCRTWAERRAQRGARPSPGGFDASTTRNDRRSTAMFSGARLVADRSGSGDR